MHIHICMCRKWRCAQVRECEFVSHKNVTHSMSHSHCLLADKGTAGRQKKEGVREFVMLSSWVTDISKTQWVMEISRTQWVMVLASWQQRTKWKESARGFVSVSSCVIDISRTLWAIAIAYRQVEVERGRKHAWVREGEFVSHSYIINSMSLEHCLFCSVSGGRKRLKVFVSSCVSSCV